ncbi:MAG TPA: WD40 repeat domain-containing protein [Candidatus Dependentiae bacterium]|nr:WD40 repeat domain-containing protein [Candidatus Dependentiae bacterium]HRQ63018.1 WD40 repeat domain-containing protein [Candidatus Dependentiae bacterium]
MMQRKLHVINFLVLFTAQLHGMESDLVMDKQDTPTNVEIPTLQALCLQKFCKEIQETLEQEGIRAVERLPYLKKRFIKKNKIHKHIVQQIQEAYVKQSGIYQKTTSLQNNDNFCMCPLAYDAVHNRLFSGSNGYERIVIKIWDIESGKLIKILSQINDDPVVCLVYDAAYDRLFSGYEDHIIRIWDTNTGACIQMLEGHTYPVECLVYDVARDRLFSGSRDNTIRIWDVMSGECMHTLEGHTRDITCLAYDAVQDRLFSGSDDGTIKIWNTMSGKCTQTLFCSHDLVGLAYNAADGHLFSAENSSRGSDTAIRVWDIVHGECIRKLCFHCSRALCLIDHEQLSNPEHVLGIYNNGAPGCLFSKSDDKAITVWDTPYGQCIQGEDIYIRNERNRVLMHSVCDVAYARLFSGSSNKTIKIWGISEWRNTLYNSRLQTLFSSTIYDKAQDRLFSLSGKSIDIWKPASFTYALCRQAISNIKTQKDGIVFRRSRTYKNLSFTENQHIEEELNVFLQQLDLH